MRAQNYKLFTLTQTFILFKSVKYIFKGFNYRMLSYPVTKMPAPLLL